MFIRSERLFLRPGWPEDWPELLGLIDDEGIVRNLARAPWPYRPEDAQWFAGQTQDPRVPHFFVTLPANGELIGSVGLGRDDEGRTELGYWIGRSHWGRGYAPEAARALLCLARTLGHGRVFAGHFIDNPASGRVLAKAGFSPTGRITPRYSVGRGCEVESVEYAIELGTPCDCDDGDCDEVAMAA